MSTRRSPHDSVRLGLPVGALERVLDAPGDDTMLLVTAGLLLGAVAAGASVLGVAAGRVARGT